MTKGSNLIDEDTPTNSAGAGNIAGIGVGPKGEPGVMTKDTKQFKRQNLESVPRKIKGFMNFTKGK